MTASVSAWMGLTTSHLYANCPGRLGGIATLQQLGWGRQHGDRVDPTGTDICGWCSRVWRARQQTEIEQREDYLERLKNCTHDEVPPLPGATCGTCGADLDCMRGAA